MSVRSKLKITVSLDRSLVEQVDRRVKGSSRETRSSLVAKALEAWNEAQRRLELEQATEEYYRSMTAREKAEDRAWVRLSSSQFLGRKV
jgi:metal-responsive CopG/Arc/MetJ family transcriptional regulator